MAGLIFPLHHYIPYPSSLTFIFLRFHYLALHTPTVTFSHASPKPSFIYLSQQSNSPSPLQKLPSFLPSKFSNKNARRVPSHLHSHYPTRSQHLPPYPHCTYFSIQISATALPCSTVSTLYAPTTVFASSHTPLQCRHLPLPHVRTAFRPTLTPCPFLGNLHRNFLLQKYTVICTKNPSPSQYTQSQSYHSPTLIRLVHTRPPLYIHSSSPHSFHNTLRYVPLPL